MHEGLTHRRPATLAALATAAVEGLDAVAVGDPQGSASGAGDSEVDAAIVADTKSRQWVIRAPRRATAGARMESEIRLLQALAARTSVSLPFAVPTPAGTVALPEGGRAVVHPLMAGVPLHAGELAPGPGLAASLGRALAALHDLPPDLADEAGLSSYDASEYRERRLAEVDRAAGTGHVPAGLLSRWERAMEDVSHWRFVPTLTHGDLVAEHVLVSGDTVTGILDWGEAKVADPADDLAWVATGADEAALDSVMEAYAVGRREQPDRHLTDRARLAGELALARWLLHGVRTDDSEVVDDAVQMLRDLDAAVSDDT